MAPEHRLVGEVNAVGGSLKSMIKSLGLAVFFVVVSGIAHADTICATGTPGCAVTSGTLVNVPSLASIASDISTGTPYWDNVSGDGNHTTMNVGYILMGACGTPSNCPVNYLSPGSQYLAGTGSPNSPSAISLHSTSSSFMVTLLEDFTGDGSLTFGYYNASDTSLPAAQASEQPIFGPLIPNDPGAFPTTAFTPISGEDYGFYLTRCAAGGSGPGGASCPGGYITVFSNPALNTCTVADPSCSTDQHFSIFTSATAGLYYVGIEDWGYLGGPLTGEANGDYNDIVFALDTYTTPVPEPATFGLIGLGLAGLGAARVRARRNRA
jgi:PEP-CTERM motif